MVAGFLSGFSGLLAREPELAALLSHPALKEADFRDLVREAAPGVHDIGLAILEGMAGARSLKRLPKVAEELTVLADQSEGVVAASVVSARALSQAERQDLAKALATVLGGKVRLEEKVEPALLGGLRVEAQGRVFDGSMRGQLEAMRKELRAV